MRKLIDIGDGMPDNTPADWSRKLGNIERELSDAIAHLGAAEGGIGAPVSQVPSPE